MIEGVITWLNDNLTTGVVGALTILAIMCSPIFALWLQKKVEDYNEIKQRKLSIFKTLLATRANTTSIEHVQALNMIDLEFYNENDIKRFWNVYRNHLNSYPHSSDKATQDDWEKQRIQYLTDLLHSMSQFFGYDFDKELLKEGAYSPLVHGLINLEQSRIRQGLAEIVSGDKPLKVVFSDKTESSK